MRQPDISSVNDKADTISAFIVSAPSCAGRDARALHLRDFLGRLSVHVNVNQDAVQEFRVLRNQFAVRTIAKDPRQIQWGARIQF